MTWDNPTKSMITLNVNRQNAHSKGRDCQTGSKSKWAESKRIYQQTGTWEKVPDLMKNMNSQILETHTRACVCVCVCVCVCEHAHTHTHHCETAGHQNQRQDLESNQREVKITNKDNWVNSRLLNRNNRTDDRRISSKHTEKINVDLGFYNKLNYVQQWQ